MYPNERNIEYKGDNAVIKKIKINKYFFLEHKIKEVYCMSVRFAISYIFRLFRVCLLVSPE